MQVNDRKQIEEKINLFSLELMKEGHDPSMVCHCLVSAGMTAISFIMPTHVRFDLLRTTCKQVLKSLDQIEKETSDQSIKH
jgi:hypothetical protein